MNGLYVEEPTAMTHCKLSVMRNVADALLFQIS